MLWVLQLLESLTISSGTLVCSGVRFLNYFKFRVILDMCDIMFCRINKMANFAWSSIFKLENPFNRAGPQEWSRSHWPADPASLRNSLFE